jgi:hypothetical protein
VLAGQSLGIREVDDGIWLAGFMHYDLGYFDLEQKTLQPLDNPFGTRLSPMSQVRGVTYVSGPDNQRAGGEGGRRTTIHLRSSAIAKALNSLAVSWPKTSIHPWPSGAVHG